MCGIVGVISSKPLEIREFILRQRDTMWHRGPDDAGVWLSEDGCIGLAHRRLSVLDLSPAGHQPMQDAVRQNVIVFNGEIYNFCDLRCDLEEKGHVFRSRSDAEVILGAYREWGPDCLAKFNGMFAFAIYDAEKKQIFLARDRAGEKPLFYYLVHGRLYFASELKALMAEHSLPRRVDPVSLDCYLSRGYIPGERCILQGYNKLPPAHAMIFDVRRGTAKIWRYWHMPEVCSAAKGEQMDEGGLLDELEGLLEDSVRRQLLADVPVGVLLSGGVDSSLITAMAVRSRTKVKTFTIGLAGHGKLDETEHARLIARHFGTEHIELPAREATSDVLPRLARQFDEPICDSSMIPTYLVSQLVRQHCTVALGGDGGDELFGGYEHYSRLLWMYAKFGWISLPVRRVAARTAGFLLPVGLKGRNWLQVLGQDFKNGLPLQVNYFDDATRRQLMRSQGCWNMEAESLLVEQMTREQELLQRATRMDFHNYLAEDILVKVDRASMLNSLEVRAPFLDYRLIEFAYGKVPSYLKATVCDKKILLKRLTTKVLPLEFDRHRKQGFSIPLAKWLKKGPFRVLFNDVLLDSQCLFDRYAVQGLLNGQDLGRSNGERLFALLMFELWRKEYKVVM